MAGKLVLVATVFSVLVACVALASAQSGVYKDYCYINIRCSQTSCRGIYYFNKCTYDPCWKEYHLVTYNPTTTQVTDYNHGQNSQCSTKNPPSSVYYVAACYNSGSSWMYKLFN